MELEKCHCDHCEGVVWPAPPTLTMEQWKEIHRNMAIAGKAFGESFDKELIQAFNEI